MNEKTKEHCIADEMFNRIKYPRLAAELAEVPLDGIVREITYKLPNGDPVVTGREVWHSVCDFCSRTGALLKSAASVVSGEDTGSAVNVEIGASSGRKFLRVVGAMRMDTSANKMVPTTDFDIEYVDAGSGGESNVKRLAVFPAKEGWGDSCEIVFSERPAFDYEPSSSDSASREWEPTIPQYIIDRYGECIAHGALMRIYALRGDGGLARMHATAYNNDLNRFSFGLITSGMRKHLLIDIEDWLVNTNGNG